MLLSFVILVLPGCCVALSSEDLRSPYSDLQDAADEIISSSFKSNAVTINFIVSLSDETEHERNTLINNLVARCDVVYVETVQFITQRHRLYSVIFIDDFESFLRLSQQMSSRTFVIDGYFLVIFVKGAVPEIAEITKRLWSIFIYNVDFLFKDESGLNLMTFLPFSNENCSNGNCQKRCGDMTPVVIHNFNESLTSKKNFFEEKISNLFQCPVKVVSFNCPPMMMIHYDKDRNYELRGPDGEMLKVLAEVLNFKIDLIHISDLIK